MDLITSYDAAETGYRVYIYRASDFEQLAVLRIPKGVASSGSFQPDAEIFALSDLEGVLHFFDSGSWEELTTLAGMEGFFIGRPQFSQGGHWLLFSWYTYDEFGDYFSGFDVWGIPE
jgi:WD40 repeat protein